MAKNKCYIPRKDVKNCVIYLQKNRMLMHMLNMIIYLHLFNQIYSAIYNILINVIIYHVKSSII